MNNEEIKSLSNRAVAVQSNSMINSKYELDPTQQKLILLAIAQIKSEDEKFFKYSCSVAELEQRLGVEIKHRQFRDTCEDLFKKPIRINNGKSWKLFNWFSSMQYIDEEARFEFKISDDLIPYLLNLKKHFTAYNIEQALFFKGKYTTRFYQFLIQAQHQKSKKRVFDLEELYELLQLPPTFREFKHFKSKVLESSLAEINEKSDIKAAYEITKKLRKKVLEITLHFDFKDVLETKTAKATQSKNLKKYTGKDFVYFGSIYHSEEVISNQEKNRIEIIYIDPSDKERARADFDSIAHLERAIREAKELKADMKRNPEQYEKKLRNIKGLF